MADFNHTAVTRKSAANILAATIIEAARNYIISETLLNPFLSLCQDTDIDIRRNMLKNCHSLLPLIKDKYITTQIFLDVNYLLS